MNAVPIVDISNPSATSLDALDEACRSHGFFLLTGHSRSDLIERMWADTERFFDSNESLRQSVVRIPPSPFGYNDRELTKRKRDHKQVFDYGDPTSERMEALNSWPSDLPGFRDQMVEFHASFGRLAADVCNLLQQVLGLASPDRQIISGDVALSTVRLNHYPLGDPVPLNDRADLAELGPAALGHHTDPGVLTLLLQDGTGGLQAQTRAGDWIDVDPQPGTIVVNLADAVQVWTNDRYVAAVHRVVPMTHRRRFSIPFFLNPTRGAVIEPIAALCDEPARYRPFAWRDFMQARNDDNFADVGAADTQISDFAVSPQR